MADNRLLLRSFVCKIEKLGDTWYQETYREAQSCEQKPGLILALKKKQEWELKEPESQADVFGFMQMVLITVHCSWEEKRSEVQSVRSYVHVCLLE